MPTLPEMPKPVMPPVLWGRAPQREREAGNVLHSNLWTLSHELGKFASCVGLLDFSREVEDLRLGSDWGFVACHQAVLGVYHCYMLSEGLSSTLNGVPAWVDKIDTVAFRQTRKRFESDFPKLIVSRHGVTHIAEMFATPEKLERNKFEVKNDPVTPTVSVYFTGTSIHGRKLIISRDGEFLSLDVTWDNYKKLEAIVTSLFEIFTPLAEFLEKELCAEIASKGQNRS